MTMVHAIVWQQMWCSIFRPEYSCLSYRNPVLRQHWTSSNTMNILQWNFEYAKICPSELQQLINKSTCSKSTVSERLILGFIYRQLCPCIKPLWAPALSIWIIHLHCRCFGRISYICGIFKVDTELKIN